MGRRRILIVESSAEHRARLERTLSDLGHEVTAIDSRAEAIERDAREEFDIIISDLTDEADREAALARDGKPLRPLAVVINPPANAPRSNRHVKAFKFGISAASAAEGEREDLRQIVEQTLACKLQFGDNSVQMPTLHEKIEFELPSDLSLMNSVLHYLNERVARLGVIRLDRSNLFVALDEAFVNAVKHGNKHDPRKFVRIAADLSANEARFTIEDEGEGFDVKEIPDPLDPSNLFKTSGRGVLLIYNIMDEVEYNERGNRLTMVKRPEQSLEAELLTTLAPDDISATNS